MHLTTALRLNETDSKPIIALIGAGGKSTLLFRLGDELAAAGKQTLLTATTRLRTQQIDRAPFSVIGGDPFLLSQELPISLRGYRQVLAMAGAAPEPGKLRGLSPETICRLSALADVDAVVERFAPASDVCTFALDDDVYGQIVGIAVVLADTSDATVRALHAWMASHLAEPKMPSRWWVVDEIPRTSRGKINREAVKTACASRPALDLVRILSAGAAT